VTRRRDNTFNGYKAFAFWPGVVGLSLTTP
jgi:hypothetical protein